jgi:hypothetical protein
MLAAPKPSNRVGCTTPLLVYTTSDASPNLRQWLDACWFSVRTSTHPGLSQACQALCSTCISCGSHPSLLHKSQPSLLLGPITCHTDQLHLRLYFPYCLLFCCVGLTSAVSALRWGCCGPTSTLKSDCSRVVR